MNVSICDQSHQRHNDSIPWSDHKAPFWHQQHHQARAGTRFLLILNDPEMTQIHREKEQHLIWSIPTIAPVGVTQVVQ